MAREKKLLYGFVAVIGVTVVLAWFGLRTPESPTAFLSPQHVYLSLTSITEDSHQLAAFFLTSFVGGGCDAASDLRIQEVYQANRLLVEILGYDFTKGPGQVCPDVLLESRGRVVLDAIWLERPGEKEVIFELNGERNAYKLTYGQCRVNLYPIEAPNVRSYESGYSQAQSAVTLSVDLYPLDECTSPS